MVFPRVDMTSAPGSLVGPGLSECRAVSSDLSSRPDPMRHNFHPKVDMTSALGGRSPATPRSDLTSWERERRWVSICQARCLDKVLEFQFSLTIRSSRSEGILVWETCRR